MNVMQKNNRLTAFILAAVILMTSFQFRLSNASAAEVQPTIEIYCENKSISSLVLEKTEKKTLTAVGLPSDASYQWQIMNPNEDIWINIADKQEDFCDVSSALIKSMLEEADYTVLRCIADIDGIQCISNSVVVVLYEEAQEVMTYSIQSGAMPLAFSDGSDAGDPPEYVTITIKYTLGGEKLFDDYKATLHYGSSFSSKVPSPTYLGYDPYIKGSDDIATLVTLSYVNLTADQVVEVEYRPGKVPYSVRYYLQNITDDNYIEDFTLSFTGEAMTGSYPKDQVEKEITGFTPLFHIPANVAADGSTVFECYYDRNYYLYSFDCNGGYGTDSIYARYGAHLVVPRPVRSGYVFKGWDEQILDPLTGVYSGDGIVDTLSDSIEAANKIYIALWEPILTTVKIVYWNENPDDDGYNYWDSRIIHTMSGTEIKAGDILAPCRMHNTVSGTDDPAYTVEADARTLNEDHGAELLKDATYHNYWASNGVDGEASFTITAHDMAHPTLDCVALDLSDAYTDMDAENMKVDIDVHVTYQNGTILDKAYNNIYLSDNFTLNKQTEQTSPITSITFTFKNRKKLVHGEWISADFEFRCAEVEIFSNTDVPISVIPNTDTVSEKEFNQYLLNTDRTTQIAEAMYNNADGTAIVVEGDGSTVINIYYKRQKYHFRMIYARTYLKSGVVTWQVPGYTQAWGGEYHDIRYYGVLPDNQVAVDPTYSYTLSKQLTEAKWADIYGNVQPSLIDSGKYDIESFVEGDYTYYALNFTVKYGQSLKDIYPLDVFNPIYSPNSPWGNYIVHSSWTGEPYVQYSYRANAYGASNTYIRTIKGKYIRAEGWMLYEDGTEFVGRYVVEREGSTIKTYGVRSYSADYTDRYVLDSNGNRIINYVAYWANSMVSEAKTWNVAAQWHYNIYLEALPEEIEDLPPISNIGEDGWIEVKEAECGSKGVTLNKDGLQYTDKKTGNVYKYVDDVYYVLYDSYYAYDNNIGNSGTGGLINQTETETKGYTFKYKRYGGTYDVDPSFEEMLKIKLTSHNSGAASGFYKANGVTTDGMIGCIGNFYYTRDDYDLRLYNQGEYLTATATGEQKAPVMYEEHLKNAIEDNFGLTGTLEPSYPASLEPGAYEFGGWYVSPLYLSGTEVTDASVMKATPMTLYAKWAPIKHTVKFYNSFDDLNDGIILEGPFEITHGEYIPTSNIPTPDKSKFLDGEEYLFVGWFYFNSEGVKTAYDPGSIPVQTDLDLFAEWYSSLSVGYTINYKDYKTKNPVADDTTGWTYAGITRTFEAKPYSELYGGGISDGARYYPLSNSSSIIVSKNASENVVTFEYGKRASVDYTVKYVDASTGEVITVDGNDNPVEGKKTVTGCTDAVVTEKYKFISGYLPDAFYKERILTYSDNDDGGDIENENVIIFYYTKDSTHARYAIKYWTQDLSDPDTYSLYDTIEGIGDIGAEIIADINGIRGFAFDSVKTAAENPSATIEGTQVKATLTVDAYHDLIINLYFNRIECEYIVRFVEYGDTENTKNLLHTDLTLCGVYGSSGSFNVTDNCTLDDATGHDADKDFETLLHNYVKYTWKDVGSTGGNYSFTFTEPQIIDEKEKWPVLLIYYTTETYEIFYIPVNRYPGLGGCDVAPYSETVNSSNVIVGSEATPDTNSNFVGWYKDNKCTQAVDPSWVDGNHIRPELSGSEKTVYYYALFEPKKTTLTIQKATEAGVTDTFLFNVKGESGTAAGIVDITVAITGSGSVTIVELPYGNYTVTEKTDWSWRYAVTGDASREVTLASDSGYIVSYTNTRNTKAWLGSETSVTNIFTSLPT